jgi:cytidylate kinase
MNYTIAQNKEVRIAISGKSGCGNTTVSTLLSETLKIPMINYTFRSLSQETGLSLAEILEKAKTDDSFDVKVDTRQVEMAKESSCVLGSRLAIWMLKEADLKVYLLADDETRANRVFMRECGNLQEIMDFTAMRDREDSIRYQKLYKIDNNDFDFVDMKIDTALYNPEQIVNQILEQLVSMGLVVKSEE